jgi:hypothetical protein
MKLTERQLQVCDNIIDESLDVIKEENTYKECFRQALAKFNIKAIKDLSVDSKKKFFSYVKKCCK